MSCCQVVELLLVPRELLFGCGVGGMLPWLILVCCKRPNVVIDMLPVVMSVIQVRERDY